MVRYLPKLVIYLLLIIVLFLALFWFNHLSLAQDEEAMIEDCPIGAIFDEIQLEDGCIERRFYQAGTIDGCQISEPILTCPNELEQELSCNSEASWTSVAAGCDNEGYFYEVRYNLCTGLVEPYYNPRRITNLCPQPVTKSCQADEEYNDFLGCKQTECGVAIYACDSDRKQKREYDDGGNYCFQAQFNRACTQVDDEVATPTPISSPPPTVTTSPSPRPQLLSSPSPLLQLTAQVKGRVVDLNNLELDSGQPINLIAQAPNQSVDELICEWHLDDLVDEQAQPITVETSCNLTENFHSDSLNQGVIRVSASVLDKKSHQVIGQVKEVKFKVKDPYPDNNCLSGDDPQIIKQCIVKQAGLDKETKSGKPLSNLMLCLLDQEGFASLLGSQPTTTKTLFEQVSLLKQAILRGEVGSWASYPLCLNR